MHRIGLQCVLPEGRDENNGSLRMEAADLPCQLQTIHIRHVDIQKSNIYSIVLNKGQSLSSFGKIVNLRLLRQFQTHVSDQIQYQLFVINADLQEPRELAADLRAFERWKLAEHTEMFARNEGDANTFEHPDVLRPRKNRETRLENGVLEAVLQPASWNVFRLEK